MARGKIIRIPIMPGASLNFRLDQEQEVSVPLRKLANSIKDFRRFWIEYWGPAFFDRVQQNFAGQGRLVGGWRALSPAYAAWKLGQYGRRPILVATGQMRETFRIGARNNVFRPTKTRVEAGSNDPKVPFHQRGTSRMPRRQVVLQLTGRSTTLLLNRFVREEMAAAGLKVKRA